MSTACGDDKAAGAPDTATEPADTTAHDVSGDTANDTQAPDETVVEADTGAPNDETVSDDAPETIVPGAFGAPCNANGDCDSGYCVEGPSGYLCTRACDTNCPSGFDCKSVAGGTDVTFLCLPRLKRLCAPCAQDFQCPGGACLLTDGEGRCAYPCLSPDECPSGFRCGDDPEAEVAGNFCLPTTGSCTCYQDVDGGQRSCTRTNEIGVCHGVETCTPASGWSECSARVAVAETCNGADDDCDGVWDDGLTGVGGACQNAIEGVGACTGTQVCTGAGGWLCQGPTPEPETCNGLDDDCDGATDEDFQDASGRFTRAADCGRCGNDCTTRFANGVGVCGVSGTLPTCVLDHCDSGFVQLGANQCVPPIDVTCQRCASDDDCYGGTCSDLEGQSVCLMPCATGTNACANGFACTAGHCAPASGSCACTPSLEGAKRTCTRASALGTCFGLETCTVAGGAASWSACSAAAPVAETCNGQDDDCNGANDDGLASGSPCTNEVAGVGACVGQALCTGSQGWICVGPTPHVETCNGQDDDCDGHADEDFTDASGRYTRDTACGGCGIDCRGRIAHGTGRCGGTADAPVCVVATCDTGYIALNDFECAVPPDLGCRPCALDSECKGGTCTSLDGQKVCVSPCGGGGTTCPQGYVCQALGGAPRCMPASGSCSCSAAIEGTQRTCFATNTYGTCFGLETCELPAGWSGCSAPTPATEVCNGQDDDCDGTADDGLTPPATPCVKTVGANTCRGAWHCAATGNGATDWVCDARTPSGESCDGFDNDCDGKTDEDFKDAGGNYVDQHHCGACGVSCDLAIPNATAFCSGAGASPRCEVQSCGAGFYQAGPLTCLPVADNTCTPCATDANCVTPGDRCLALDGGHFCGRDCAAGNLHGTAAGACDAGFTCRDLPAVGAGVRQCVPSSNSCTCLAGDAGKARTCTRQNATGTCYGSETCDPTSGWSACSARTPASETCNAVDDDCNSAVDDVRGRGTACSIDNGFGHCPGTLDCKSGAALTCVGPTPAGERCNGIDDDCNGATDDALAAPLCPKQLGVCSGAQAICAGGAGFLACNQGNYGADYELSETRCDGLDNDCDGLTDEVDLDGDHHIAEACGGDDCDDTDRLSYAGAPEICGDAADNDCNGEPDDRDADGDGFIAAACGGDDCNDGAALANPSLFEACGDHLDNDCDGSIDNKDADHDTYVDVACGGTDCDDGREDVFPGRAELCDGHDNDCNGVIDDKDVDHDGYRDVACGGDDCDDARPLVNPGGNEVCGNLLDEDCSGHLNDKDSDHDGHVDSACTSGDDCDDADPQVFLAAAELWDAKDDDCDGAIDEGVVSVGAVIVSEVMRDPARSATDADGEYFEVTNVSQEVVNMKGWIVKDDGTDTFTVTTPVVLAPGHVAVFCHNSIASENGGVPCDFEYGSTMALANASSSSTDEIVLRNGTVEIDRVVLSNSMPNKANNGRAMNLKPASYLASANDTPTNWCDTPNTVAYAMPGGDWGTPRSINPSCTSGEPGVILVVPASGVDDGGELVTIFGSGFASGMSVSFGGSPCTSVSVVTPTVLVCATTAHAAGAVSVTVTVGGVASAAAPSGYLYTGAGAGMFDLAVLDTATPQALAPGQVGPIVAAHVHSAALTETAGPPTGVLAEVGYGPLGTDPGATAGWHWRAAIWTAQVGTSDAFGRALVITTPGTYSYAFRFSTDAGLTWLYADRAPGTANGFAPADLGTVTVTP